MSFHSLPKILHEILGLLMFVMTIVHFVWNRHAFMMLNKNFKKRLSMFIDVMLFLCILTIIFTGMCISNHLFNGMIDMKLQRNITIHQLHVAAPYLFMILSGIHLGLHWPGFRQRLNNIFKFDMTTKFYKFTCRILTILLILIGIYGSFLNRVGDRLLMEHIFATPATDLPFILFVSLIISIFSIYVVIGIFIDKKY